MSTERDKYGRFKSSGSKKSGKAPKRGPGGKFAKSAKGKKAYKAKPPITKTQRDAWRKQQYKPEWKQRNGVWHRKGQGVLRRRFSYRAILHLECEDGPKETPITITSDQPLTNQQVVQKAARAYGHASERYGYDCELDHITVDTRWSLYSEGV